MPCGWNCDSTWEPPLALAVKCVNSCKLPVRCATSPTPPKAQGTKTNRSIGTLALDVKFCAGGKGDLKRVAPSRRGAAMINGNIKDAIKARVSRFIEFFLS